MKKINSKKLINTSYAYIPWLFLIFLLFNGTYFSRNTGISKHEIVSKIIWLLSLAIVPIFVYHIPTLNRIGEKIKNKIQDIYHFIVDDVKVTIKRTLIVVIGFMIGFLGGLLLSKFASGTIHTTTLVASGILIGLWVSGVVLIWRQIEYHPEYLFTLCIMLIGCFYIGMTQMQMMSWDEGIHYRNTTGLLRIFNAYLFDSDYWIQCHNGVPDLKYLEVFQDLYDQHIGHYIKSSLSINSISYLPEALGILIGRGLHLSLKTTYLLGRLGNLCFYTFIISAAIKKLKSGKAVICIFSLFPTIITMAGAYSYDSWVISWTVLGFCTFFRQYQIGTTKYSMRELVKAVIFIAIGCIPKAIYFPLLFPFCFLARDHFKSKKEQTVYKVTVIVLMVFLLYIIASPFLVPGSSALQGDSRGGNDVNSLQQMLFIIHNPLRYAKILVHFLVSTYLPLKESYQYTVSMAYMGNGYFGMLVIVLFYVTGFLDHKAVQGQKWHHQGVIKLMILFVLVVCVVLIPTALYVSFTSVALNTINGCQLRYLLPLIVPFIFVLVPDSLDVKANRTWLFSLPMFIMTFVNMYSFYVNGYIKMGFHISR